MSGGSYSQKRPNTNPRLRTYKEQLGGQKPMLIGRYTRSHAKAEFGDRVYLGKDGCLYVRPSAAELAPPSDGYYDVRRLAGSPRKIGKYTLSEIQRIWGRSARIEGSYAFVPDDERVPDKRGRQKRAEQQKAERQRTKREKRAQEARERERQEQGRQRTERFDQIVAEERQRVQERQAVRREVGQQGRVQDSGTQPKPTDERVTDLLEWARTAEPCAHIDVVQKPVALALLRQRAGILEFEPDAWKVASSYPRKAEHVPFSTTVCRVEGRPGVLAVGFIEEDGGLRTCVVGTADTDPAAVELALRAVAFVMNNCHAEENGATGESLAVANEWLLPADSTPAPQPDGYRKVETSIVGAGNGTGHRSVSRPRKAPRQHVVRAHGRWVACGEGRKERRWVHVESFIRGGGDFVKTRKLANGTGKVVRVRLGRG